MKTQLRSEEKFSLLSVKNLLDEIESLKEENKKLLLKNSELLIEKFQLKNALAVKRAEVSRIEKKTLDQAFDAMKVFIADPLTDIIN
jgi:regulator of replication initiation timing